MRNDTLKQNPSGRAPSRWIVPLVILAFAAAAFHLTTTFDRVPPILKRGIQPSDFPQLVILLIITLATWLMLRDREAAPKQLPNVVYITLGLLIVFPILALLDMFLALSIVSALLSMLWGKRQLWALVFVTLIVPAAVFFLFDSVFDIRFPKGLLTNLWYG